MFDPPSHWLKVLLRRPATDILRFLRWSQFQVISDLIGVEKLREYVKATKARGEVETPRPLTRAEIVAIWTYTTDQWHRRINGELRSGAVSPEVKRFARFLNQTLNKLFIHLGIVYRGIEVDEAELDYIFDFYQPGRVLTWHSFTSTSKEESSAYGGNVLFVIWSLKGRSIEMLSSKPYEREVLFRTGTRFRVKGRAWVNDHLLVELEEVD